MRTTEWKRGSFSVLCDRCGFKYKAEQLKEEYDGLMVCHGPNTLQCWEPRHPQEMIRPLPEPAKLPWTRPEPPDVYLFSCSTSGRRGVADFGTAYCMMAYRDYGYR